MKKRTKMPIIEFLKGLEILMNLRYFQFNINFYQQINGMPIGLSVSPILADFVSKDLETDFYLDIKNLFHFM